MTYQYHVASLPLLLATLVSMGTTWYVWQLRTRWGAMALVRLGLAAALWSLGYALEIAGADLPTKLFWGKFQFFAISTIPLGWFLFVWQYTDRHYHLSRRIIVWLSVIPITTIILALTTEWHGLIWSDYRLAPVGDLLTLEISRGPWFWVYWAYAQLLIFGGIVLIVRAQRRPLNRDSRPTAILLVASLAPWASNLSYVIGLTPINLTPLVIALSVVTMTFVAFRFRLIYLLPIARETIIEDMQDGILVVDGDGVVADINPAAQQIFGFAADEGLGQSLAQILRPWPDLVAKYSLGDEGQDEITITTAGGERIYGLRFSKVRNRRGSYHERIITIRDITQTKLGEKNLVHQADNLATLYQLSQTIVSTLDSEQVYAAAHQAVAQLMAVEAFYIALFDQTKGTIQDAYLFDRGQRWPNELSHIDEQGLTAQVIRTGEPLWIKDDSQNQSQQLGRVLFGEPEDTLSILIAPLKLHNNIIGVISAQHYQPNIYTEEHLYLLVTLGNQVAIAIENARLVRSLHLQAAVLDATANAILIHDANWVIQWVNPAFTELTGYTAAEAIGRTPVELLRSDKHDDAFYEELRNTGKAGRLWQGEIINRRKDGSLYVEWQTITPVFDEDGQASRFIAVKQDITELVRAKEQALEASRLKSQLLARVNHELRTPLSVILGYAELLQEGVYGSLTPGQERVLNEIVDSNRQLTEMVSELLNQAQLESGNVTLRRVPFSPRELLQGLKVKMDVLARKKNIKLSMKAAPDLPSVLLGDEKRLREILINLGGNALKFTQTGEVEVYLFCPDKEHWAMRVRDTGPGIPIEAQTFIFEPFRQVDGSSTREHRGSGLGLSIVQLLVNLMNGEILLTSEMGQGSTFTVVLPLE